MKFLLETARIRIRQFQESDLESFLEYRNDPEVARYQGWDVPYPRERGMEFIAEMTSKKATVKGEWFQAAIEEISTIEIVGDVAFFLKKDNPQAYIGYTIARPHWRKGYGMEATLSLLDYLFGELDLHRVIAITDVENIASFHMLERIGFRREAHFVENSMSRGHWVSEYYYAMLKREWEQLTN